MDSKFNPPQTKKEFLERAEKVDTKAALSMLNALKSRRASAVRALDIEIRYYEQIVELRKTGDVVWPEAEEQK